MAAPDWLIIGTAALVVVGAVFVVFALMFIVRTERDEPVAEIPDEVFGR